jgi:hypothetical protein
MVGHTTELPMTTTKFTIPAYNLANLQAEVTRQQRKATKLGVECPALAVVSDEYDVDVNKNKPLIDFPGGIRTERWVRFVDIEVSGVAPRINGWAFVATIEHIDNECMVRTVPNSEVALPTRFRTATAVCEHCNAVRRRQETFVLVNDDGSFKQVGRQCLKDFLGYNKAPETLATIASCLWSALDLALVIDGDDEGGFGGGRVALGMVTYLALVAMIIESGGWMPRGRARDLGVESTADMAITAYFKHFPVSAAQIDEAKAALEWARNTICTKDIEARTDYEHNIAVIAKYDSVDFKQVGYAASIVSSYQREQNRLKAKEMEFLSFKDSKFVGVIGKRMDVQGRLVEVKTIVGDIWGNSYLHKFVTTEGDLLVWFASSRPLDANNEYIEPSDKLLTLSVTPKKQEPRGGVNQTTVSRAVIWSDEAVEKTKEKAAKKAARAAKKTA